MVIVVGIVGHLGEEATAKAVLHATEGLVTVASSVAFLMLTFSVSFPVGGGAAGTALMMPALAPLGDLAGVDRAMAITPWTAATGWLRHIVPVNAILIAGLSLARVGFDQCADAHAADCLSPISSAAPGGLDRGDVDLLHAHHRSKRPLCFIAANCQRLDQHAWRDLPGDAPLVFAPALDTGIFGPRRI